MVSLRKYSYSINIQNIDIYPLLCKLMSIEAAPNNGSLSRIQSVLASHTHKESVDDDRGLLSFIAIVITVFLVVNKLL